MGDYSLLMPGRGKLGELPNRSAPIFQEERFFVPSAPAQLPQPLPHPDSRRDSPASGEGERRNSLVARSIAVEGYSVAISLGMSCKALLTTLLLNASKERRSNGIAPGCEPGVVGSDFIGTRSSSLS